MSRYDRYSRHDRYSFFPPSKSKGERLDDAARQRVKLEKKGIKLSPVVLDGFALATTFWGKAWNKNIEAYQDYAYRLPRGRSYVRSNSVIDLQVEPGIVQARVMGSELYRVKIAIKPVAAAPWAAIRAACSGKIGSLVELLRGGISGEVMEVMTRPGAGLFPRPDEITFSCSCPDVAGLCKHVAAALYGVGNRLDRQPELLFRLRGVDSAELIASVAAAPTAAAAAPAAETLATEEVADVFGVELEDGGTATVRPDDAKTFVKVATPARKPKGRPPRQDAGTPAGKRTRTKRAKPGKATPFTGRVRRRARASEAAF